MLLIIVSTDVILLIFRALYKHLLVNRVSQTFSIKTNFHHKIAGFGINIFVLIKRFWFVWKILIFFHQKTQTPKPLTFWPKLKYFSLEMLLL